MDSQTGIAIRRARTADAPELAALAGATFAETFAHITPENMAHYLATEETPEHYAQLISQPGMAVWLATAPDGAVVGFLTAGHCKLPAPGREPRAGEIHQLYLRSDVQGQGLGTVLLQTGLDWLRAQGYRPLYIGVWSQNLGAQRLYGRYGFEKVGEYDYPVGEHLDREFILRERDPSPTEQR